MIININERKLIIKILSFLVILLLIILSAGISFALESERKDEMTDKNVIQSQAFTAQGNMMTDFNIEKSSNIEPITAIGKDSVFDRIYSDIRAVPLYYSNTKLGVYLLGNDKELQAGEMVKIPVRVDISRYLYSNIVAECSTNEDDNVSVVFDCGNKATDDCISASGIEETTGGVYHEKGETCDLLITNGSDSGTMHIYISPYVVPTASSRNLSQGASKWTIASTYNKSWGTSTVYYKVKPDRTGIMKVVVTSSSDFGKYGVGVITLYNSNKKPVSNAVIYDTGGAKGISHVYFGVKNRNTYYLKATECDGEIYYGIKYTMTSVTDRALGTKSKAKKLKRKAASTSTLFTASTSKNTDWYKIYVSTKRKTVIRINTESIKSGNIYVTVYKGSKKLGSKTIKANIKQTDLKLTYGTTTGKANSGTYYIKLVKGTKASGKYTIRYLY